MSLAAVVGFFYEVKEIEILSVPWYKKGGKCHVYVFTSSNKNSAYLSIYLSLYVPCVWSREEKLTMGWKGLQKTSWFSWQFFSSHSFTHSLTVSVMNDSAVNDDKFHTQKFPSSSYIEISISFHDSVCWGRQTRKMKMNLLSFYFCVCVKNDVTLWRIIYYS